MDTFDQKCQRGLEEMRANNFAEGRKLFEEAIAIQPGSSYALSHMAVCDFELGATDQALAGAKLAVELRGEDPNPCFFFGRMLFRCGQAANGVQYLQSAADSRPNFLCPSCWS